MRRVSIFILLVLAVSRIIASPAYPYPVEVTQPDGSKIMMLIRGDESRRYRTTLMGNRLVMGEDGFYRSTFEPLVQEALPKHIAPVANRDVSALIIPVQFKDKKFSVEDPRTHFEKMMNMTGYDEYNATGSVKDYFEDNLKGIKNVSFAVTKVVQLDNILSYYGENRESARSEGAVYDVRVEDMVREACSKVNPTTDFSKYNYVFVYYAGYSEAEGGDPDSIWPASLNLSSNPITHDGARINTVGCAAELRGASGFTPSGIGAFCHEFGHVLGLPDLYDVDYEANGRAKGMWGTLSLMDYGCYNNQGRTPPYLNAVERELLGVEGERLMAGGTHYLEPVNLNGKFYRVDTFTKDEYYLIESRQERSWDAYIGGSGMLIYHIDKSVNPAGMINASVRWSQNLINTYSEHECADLVEAVADAVNVKQVFFPGVGNVSTFSTLSLPHFVSWDMRGVGLKLKDIKTDSEAGVVSFNVEQDDDEILLSAEDVSIEKEQTSADLLWSTSIDMDARWGVRWRKDGDTFAESDRKVVEETRCLIENLKSGQLYVCEIFHIGYKKYGDTLNVKFKTEAMTSPYPYIYNLRPVYSVGDTAMLKIYNLGDMTDEIVWRLNGVEVENGQFVFNTLGENEISVNIRYMQDGSRETITRKVLINEKEDDDENGQIGL